jgi:hypothetical protein
MLIKKENIQLQGVEEGRAKRQTQREKRTETLKFSKYESRIFPRQCSLMPATLRK